MTDKNLFLFDKNRCVGCEACVVACRLENSSQGHPGWRTIHNSNPWRLPGLPLFYLSLACNHCEAAPCLEQCPARAYTRDEKTGAVLHHEKKCLGCKYCTWACPFDAPKYRPDLGVVEKCTFCQPRLKEGLKPACASLCPTGALDLAQQDFSMDQALASSPLPVRVGSRLKVTEPRKASGPDMDQSLFLNQPRELAPAPGPEKISARHELPLVAFSLLSVVLVVLALSERTLPFNLLGKLLFLGAAGLSGWVSSLHLGRRPRAWRALLNLRGSWLSREIACFTLFYLLVFWDFFLGGLPWLLVAGSGILFLASIDRLYGVAMWRWPSKVHSGQTLLIALHLSFLIHSLTALFVLLGLIRAGLYLYQKTWNRKWRISLSSARLVLLALSLACLLLEQGSILALALFALGEIIDRLEFYDDLRVPEL